MFSCLLWPLPKCLPCLLIYGTQESEIKEEHDLNHNLFAYSNNYLLHISIENSLVVQDLPVYLAYLASSEALHRTQSVHKC